MYELAMYGTFMVFLWIHKNIEVGNGKVSLDTVVEIETDQY